MEVMQLTLIGLLSNGCTNCMRSVYVCSYRRHGNDVGTFPRAKRNISQEEGAQRGMA
jgi:hypothetical protein